MSGVDRMTLELVVMAARALGESSNEEAKLLEGEGLYDDAQVRRAVGHAFRKFAQGILLLADLNSDAALKENADG